MPETAQSPRTLSETQPNIIIFYLYAFNISFKEFQSLYAVIVNDLRNTHSGILWYKYSKWSSSRISGVDVSTKYKASSKIARQSSEQTGRRYDLQIKRKISGDYCWLNWRNKSLTSLHPQKEHAKFIGKLKWEEVSVEGNINVTNITNKEMYFLFLLN